MDANHLQIECERISELGRGKPSELARHEIEAALHSKWEGLQITAARALAAWGDVQSLEAVRRILSEFACKPAHWSAAGAVAAALRPCLGPQDIDWVLTLCLKESNRHNRHSLMTLLLGLPSEETRATLRRMAQGGGCNPAEVRNALYFLEIRARSLST